MQVNCNPKSSFPHCHDQYLKKRFHDVETLQKNAHVVRSADERRGLEQLSMDVAVNLTHAWHLSTHIRNVCGEAQQAYTSQADLTRWTGRGG